MSGRWIPIAGGTLLVLHIVYFLGATCDDAFISFRYAVNLANGQGLVFNPGERVEGFSNPLWVLLLAGTAVIGMSPVLVAKVVGITSLLGVVLLADRLARELDWGTIERGSLFFLLGCNWPLAYYAASGLETLFYAFLILAAGLRFFDQGERLDVVGAVLALLVAWTRPEGILFAGILTGLHVWRRGVRGLALPLLVFTAGYALLVGGRLAYFGELLPNTFQVKSPMRAGLGPGWVRLLIGGMDELVAFVSHNGGPVLAVLAILPLRRSRSPVVVIAASLFAGGLFFLKFAGGDWMAGYRFLVPFLPLYLLLALEGLRRLPVDLPFSRERAFAVVAIAMGVFALAGSARFHLERGRYPYFIMTGEDMVSAARWIGDRYPPETEIVCWRIGALGYYSGLRVIDTWGLTDRSLARFRHEGEEGITARNAYIATLAPRLVLSSHDAVAGAERDFHGRPFRLVRTFPQGSDQVWALWEAVEDEAGVS